MKLNKASPSSLGTDPVPFHPKQWLSQPLLWLLQNSVHSNQGRRWARLSPLNMMPSGCHCQLLLLKWQLLICPQWKEMTSSPCFSKITIFSLYPNHKMHNWPRGILWEFSQAWSTRRLRVMNLRTQTCQALRESHWGSTLHTFRLSCPSGWALQ